MSDFTFTINSTKHGEFKVIAPERFRAEIEDYTWHVLFDKKRSEGRQFVLGTNISSENRTSQTTLLLHVLIWKLIGNPKVKQIDHVDGNPLNNAENNLKDGSVQNQHNQRSLRRDNKSGVKGVNFHKASNKWLAEIRINNKNIHLGVFNNILEAKEARDNAAIKYHRGFAVTNEKDLI